MPRVTRWFIRTGMVYLLTALALGVLRAWPGGGALLPAAWPAYVHLLAVGWLTQLIFGVAYWMFPTDPSPRVWGPRLAWWAYCLLNAGLVGRLVAEPIVTTTGPGGAAGAVLVVAAGAQLMGAVAMVVDLWPRVRGRGR
jgi:hypothetical protein